MKRARTLQESQSANRKRQGPGQTRASFTAPVKRYADAPLRNAKKPRRAFRDDHDEVDHYYNKLVFGTRDVLLKDAVLDPLADFPGEFHVSNESQSSDVIDVDLDVELEMDRGAIEPDVELDEHRGVAKYETWLHSYFR